MPDGRIVFQPGTGDMDSLEENQSVFPANIVEDTVDGDDPCLLSRRSCLHLLLSTIVFEFVSSNFNIISSFRKTC